jgi:eight-cysteine-cluster-containing protein
MKSLIAIGLVIVLLSGCVIPIEPGDWTLDTQHKTDFCGFSTGGKCNNDYDCVRDGCSNQVCRAANEGPITTTCEYKECYSAGKFGVECSCVNNQCQWQ